MARVVHFEIHAADPNRAIAFYSELLGWKFQKWEGPMPYWLIVTGPAGTRGIDGGLILRQCAMPHEGSPINAYVCTVEVEQIDEVVSRIEALGGRIAVPRMPIPKVGWLAYAKDPEGNLFGMMQPDSSAL